jgi:uncharacterized repeat protein (TIGR03803 family)
LHIQKNWPKLKVALSQGLPVKDNTFFDGLRAASVIVLAVTLMATNLCAAVRENVLHSFSNNGRDGSSPLGGLIFDALGNLYGTTRYGGTYNSGAVFELMPKAGGGWSEKILYSFIDNNKDGVGPYASVVFDAKGNLYGTTCYGGTYGDGIIFELLPRAGGAWTEKVLHTLSTAKMEAVPLLPDLRREWQSLWHGLRWRRLRLGYSVRVDAFTPWRLEGEGAVQLPKHRRLPAKRLNF